MLLTFFYTFFYPAFLKPAIHPKQQKSLVFNQFAPGKALSGRLCR
ncbi:hypothetical protein NIASO_11190 [Niabella soli DSM 19437]|uniref:Uncharacterized protein n=1 Tax=Niabella soli DSM 19437 TaxID=929713 RepID=W0F3L4_9BACT|nr:hypothetical protein NIASO_11190 [Niabella soli DSM 19437]